MGSGCDFKVLPLEGQSQKTQRRYRYKKARTEHTSLSSSSWTSFYTPVRGVRTLASEIECRARFALSLLGAYPMGSTHFRPLSKFIGGLRLPLVVPHGSTTEQLRFHTHKRREDPADIAAPR